MTVFKGLAEAQNQDDLLHFFEAVKYNLAVSLFDGYKDELTEAQLYAREVRQRNPSMQVKRITE